VKKPLLTKWCLDPAEPSPGESYEEDNAYAPVLSSGSAPQSYGVPAPTQPAGGYGAPPSQPPGDYGAPAAAPPGGYGAPTAAAPGGYIAPAGDYDAPVYDEFPPTNSYEAAGPISDTFSNFDDPFQSPSAPASDIYSGGYEAPSTQAAGGYSAPSSQAAGGYSAPQGSIAPLDEAYASPRNGRTFKRPQTSVLPRRPFRG